MKKGTKWIIGAAIASVCIYLINKKREEREKKETEEIIDFFGFIK